MGAVDVVPRKTAAGAHRKLIDRLALQPLDDQLRDTRWIALKAKGVRQLLYYQLIGPPASVSWRSGLMDTALMPHPAFDAVRAFVAQNSARIARR